MRSLSEIEMCATYNEIARITQVSSERISQMMNFAGSISPGKATPKKTETRRPG